MSTESATAAAKYARPPITEAVIEIRFGERFGQRDLERLRDRFARDLPKVEETYDVNVSVESGKASTQLTQSGYKLTSADARDIVFLFHSNLLTSRLAPYQGWEVLFQATKDNF